MSGIGRTLGFGAALIGILTLLIYLPSIGLGIGDRWQVLASMLIYLVFFTLGTGQRMRRHGDLAERKQDRQVRSRSGRLAFAGLIVGMLAVHWLGLFSLSRQDAGGLSIWSWIGLALAAGGLVINQMAVRTLGRFFDRLTIKEGHQLVTEGIYGVVRHPIYTSYLCLFFSYCFLMQSWPAGALLIVVCALWFGNRIATEEAMLTGEFGEAYEEYSQRTKRLIPFVY